MTTEKQGPAKQISESQIILEVNIQAESFYEDAVKLGDHAAYALGKDHRSQMTGLESVAESAFKAADVWDYVKRQIGHSSRSADWQRRAPADASFKDLKDQPFGERLKNYLEDELKKRCESMCESKLGIDKKTKSEKELMVRRRAYLLLIRHFIRSMVIQYEYRVGFAREQKEGGR
jgi:hypothetical protein